MNPSLKTAYERGYQELVGRVDPETTDGSEQESGSSADEASVGPPFTYGYQLFTAGLVLGYAEGETTDDEPDYEVVRLSGFTSKQHSSVIEAIFNLILCEKRDNDTDEDDIWRELLQHADYGVKKLSQEYDEGIPFPMDQVVEDLNWERAQEVVDELEEEQDQELDPGLVTFSSSG